MDSRGNTIEIRLTEHWCYPLCGGLLLNVSKAVSSKCLRAWAPRAEKNSKKPLFQKLLGTRLGLHQPIGVFFAEVLGVEGLIFNQVIQVRVGHLDRYLFG